MIDPGSLNGKVYKLEQRLVGVAMAVMGTVVFLDVVHRTAAQQNGMWFRLLDEAPYANTLGTAIGFITALVITYGSLRIRGRGPGATTWGMAGAIVLALYVALRIFLVVVPNGLVWSQTLGLVLMLWVGCVGASTATAEHRHLALDLGSRLWPKKILPFVQGVGNLVTAVFCLALAFLGVVSLRSHYGDYSDTGGAGGVFPALPIIPKWLVFFAIPTGFSVMAIRFLGQTKDSMKGEVEEDDPLQMLGIHNDESQAASEKPAPAPSPAPSSTTGPKPAWQTPIVAVPMIIGILGLALFGFSTISTTAVVLGSVLLLVLIGARLFVVVGVATMLSFILILGEGLNADGLVRIVNKMENLTTKNVFLSIPFFVAAGTVMTQGGMAARLIRIARAFVAWMPGGLAIASVVACIVFAAISGSSPVTLVAVGSIMFPALVQSGYPERAAIGLLTTAGSLGCLVPPSIAMLIYAISVSGSAAVDPKDLFLAGFLPAMAITGLLGLYAFGVGRKLPHSREPFSWANAKDAVQQGIFAAALPVIVVGGIYTGQFTPTEAGAVALAYSVLVTTVVHGDLKPRQLMDLFAESATLIGSLILIVVLAFGLNDFLAEIDAAERMGNWLRTANLSPMSFMLATNAVLIVLGALMDSVSATLVFAPLLAPIALDVYGIDPVHFGVVFVVNMEIGYIAPPVATNLFVAAAIFRRSFGEVTLAVLPTLAIVCAALVVIIYVPTLSKGLLNLRNDQPFVEAFPWDGKRVLGKPDPTGDPEPATAPTKTMTMEEMMKAAEQKDANPSSTPGKVMTMEEMMKAAEAQQKAAEPEPAPQPGKVMTMEEMMKAAEKQMATVDAGN